MKSTLKFAVLYNQCSVHYTKQAEYEDRDFQFENSLHNGENSLHNGQMIWKITTLERLTSFALGLYDSEGSWLAWALDR